VIPSTTSHKGWDGEVREGRDAPEQKHKPKSKPKPNEAQAQARVHRTEGGERGGGWVFETRVAGQKRKGASLKPAVCNSSRHIPARHDKTRQAKTYPVWLMIQRRGLVLSLDNRAQNEQDTHGMLRECGDPRVSDRKGYSNSRALR
jgi:hypothetical protein